MAFSADESGIMPADVVAPTPAARQVVLTLDVGGTHAKARCAHWPEKREAESGRAYAPEQLVADVERLLAGEKVDVITIGLPAPLRAGRPLRDPVNLGPGWKDFDYRAAFGRPVKILNDAAMQAIGSCEALGLRGGTMLFLGLGTGLGSCMIADHRVIPMELAHLPFRKGRTFEDYVGARGRARRGTRRWRGSVAECVRILSAALIPDVIVLGGGNARALKEIPPGCVLGSNDNAFLGGDAVWRPEWASAATEL